MDELLEILYRYGAGDLIDSSRAKLLYLNFLCFLTLKAIYAVTRPHPDHHNTRALCEHSPSYIPDCLIRHSPEDRQ